MSRRMAARLAVAKDILGYECDRPITLRWNDPHDSRGAIQDTAWARLCKGG